jgi:hypothetical protein
MDLLVPSNDSIAGDPYPRIQEHSLGKIENRLLSLGARMRSGMNWKHLISIVLLLVLVPPSTFSLSCEVTCGLTSMTSYHRHLASSAGANASKSVDMSQMDCDSMQQEHQATATQIPARYAFTSQSCDEGPCVSDRNWLVEQNSSIDQPELTWSSILDPAIPPSGASILVPLSSPSSLPPPPYRPHTVLRI